MGKYKRELKDNSFLATFKRGQGCEFGLRGFNRLAPNKGKAFKKEKAKLKLKNYNGGNA
jgi:hypothetical protein